MAISLASLRAFALACSFALFATASYAQNPCASDATKGPLQLAQSDSGLSGTGRSGGDDSGIGGTGRSGGDESGFGGTGLSGGDDSGIGGTGIYGTITAFGSICVNGLRVHYDDDTPVEFDGESAHASLLEVGQVVVVEAMGRAGELHATRVGVHSLLTGPITAFDADARSIDVMGARVELEADAFARAEAMEPGTRVSIGGLRRGDGVVVASQFDAAPAGAPDAVAGLALPAARGGLSIGGIEISDASRIEAGTHVRARGRFDAATGAFEAERIEASNLLPRDVEQLSVEGYVQEVGAEGRVFLPGVEVDRASLERVGAGIERDRPVRVLGRRDDLGRLRVQRLQRVERPQMSRDALRAKARAGSDRAARPKKPEKARAVKQRRDRVDRPTLVRPEKPVPPPRVERPPKVDRPTLIDSNIRDSISR